MSRVALTVTIGLASLTVGSVMGSSTSGSGRTRPATAARSSEIASPMRDSARVRSSGVAQIAAIRAAMPW